MEVRLKKDTPRSNPGCVFTECDSARLGSGCFHAPMKFSEEFHEEIFRRSLSTLQSQQCLDLGLGDSGFHDTAVWSPSSAVREASGLFTQKCNFKAGYRDLAKRAKSMLGIASAPEVAKRFARIPQVSATRPRALSVNGDGNRRILVTTELLASIPSASGIRVVSLRVARTFRLWRFGNTMMLSGNGLVLWRLAAFTDFWRSFGGEERRAAFDEMPVDLIRPSWADFDVLLSQTYIFRARVGDSS